MSTALDTQWYRQLAPLSVEVLQYLKSDLKGLHDQKQLFLAGDIANPFFDYSHIELGELYLKKEGLLSLQKEIVRHEHNGIIRDLYTAKIDEYLANITLLQSAYGACTDQSAVEAHIKSFDEANDFLYGKPDRAIFNGTLYRLRLKLRSVPEAVKVLHAQHYERLSSLVYDLPAKKPLYRFAIEKAQRPVREEIYDIAEVIALFQSALAERGLSPKWNVEVDQTGHLETFSVIGHKRVIKIPGQEFFDRAKKRGDAYTRTRIQGLIAHEVETHVVRRRNGRTSSLRLLGAGLDRYRKGDEGIATFRSQQARRSRSFAGFLGHLSVGLAYGLEPNGTKKNFAELYEVLLSYFLVVGGYELVRSKDKAWHMCWRIFRGTTCSVPGVVFSKDALYREGNILIHQLLSAYPEAEQDFNVGNFDPTKKTHVRALCTLGLLAEDPWLQIAEDFCI
jgi:hypothetical protein